MGDLVIVSLYIVCTWDTQPSYLVAAKLLGAPYPGSLTSAPTPNAEYSTALMCIQGMLGSTELFSVSWLAPHPLLSNPGG